MPKKTSSSKNTGNRYQSNAATTSGSKASAASKQKSNTASSSTSAASKSRQVDLKKIFEKELNDTYDSEKQIVEALPKMAKAADSEDLQDAFEHHLEQTKKQVERLDKIFERTGIQKTGETCEATQGLIKECQEVIDDYDRSPARDSALIIGAQKIEHYEIASYGSLCELADVLGMHKVCDILDRTLAEEEDTDHTLTEIAMHVNDEAAQMGSNNEDEDENNEEEGEDLV
jgi:ferritin-like metal-binding protein YciE